MQPIHSFFFLCTYPDCNEGKTMNPSVRTFAFSLLPAPGFLPKRDPYVPKVGNSEKGVPAPLASLLLLPPRESLLDGAP